MILSAMTAIPNTVETFLIATGPAIGFGGFIIDGHTDGWRDIRKDGGTYGRMEGNTDAQTPYVEMRGRN